jgi:hypothetical protein
MLFYIFKSNINKQNYIYSFLKQYTYSFSLSSIIQRNSLVYNEIIKFLWKKRFHHCFNVYKIKCLKNWGKEIIKENNMIKLSKRFYFNFETKAVWYSILFLLSYIIIMLNSTESSWIIDELLFCRYYDILSYLRIPKNNNKINNFGIITYFSNQNYYFWRFD